MKYVVPKRTLTYADTLEAIGLGSLLEEITGSPVRLVDKGDHYVLDGNDPGPVTGWPAISPGYPFIYLKKDGVRPTGYVIDYEHERDKANRLRQFRQATKTRARIERELAEQGLSEPPQPVSEYRMASFLASMRKGWSSDKQLFMWIKEHPEQMKQWVANRLSGDNVGGTPQGLPRISNSQVFNPISGKGVHRPKPDSTTAGSISSEVIDPFNEWMKFRGAYRSMLPYRNSDGDYKVFVIEPSDIVVGQLITIFAVLRDLNLWGSIRLDIEATLRLTEILIQHSDVMGNSILLRNRRPCDVVRGLHQAYFQNLGTAAALMNYSFTVLPSWFEIRNRDDANACISIIREHIGDKQRDGVAGCLRSLNEERSGDIPVLQQYRKWLNTGEVAELLEFCYGFAVHYMHRRSQDKWAKMMSTDNLNTLFGRGYKMLDVIENKGFQSLAKAIRNATVFALIESKQKKSGRREVRYGLAQHWKQKIKGGNDEFVAALGDFVQQYNWESEKLDTSEQGTKEKGRKNHKVNASDLDQVIRLIYEKGSGGAELVGMLLLAYGYSRPPKASSTEPELDETVAEGEINE